jgi:hypothetical protein
MDKRRLVAIWVTRGRIRRLELWREADLCYTYNGDDCGGVLGMLSGDQAAIDEMEGVNGPAKVLRERFRTTIRAKP